MEEQKRKTPKKIRDLKVKNLCAQNIRSKNIKTDNLVADNTTTKNLKVSNIILNGRDMSCILNSPPIEDENGSFDPKDNNGNPIRNPKINEVVYNALLCNANAELEALRERLTEGRAIIHEFEQENSCAQCGPTGPVEINIYGYITQPLVSIKLCNSDEITDVGNTGSTGSTGSSSETQLQTLQKMFYNLEIDYDVRVANSTQPRVVSVLCHLAYIDPENITDSGGATGLCSIPQGNCGAPVCGPVYIEEILIGNKQFTPTIDPLYGEMFSGTVALDSTLVNIVANAMPDPNNTAAVQLVFFVEEGLTVWESDNNRIKCNGKSCKDTPVTSEKVFFEQAGCQNEGTMHLTPCFRRVDGGVKLWTCVDDIDPNFEFEILPEKQVKFTNTTARYKGRPADYAWDFGDGQTLQNNQDQPVFTHTYAEPGQYNVVLNAHYSELNGVHCPRVRTVTKTVVVPALSKVSKMFAKIFPNKFK